jgi:PRD1 phage membrane DNA delivery
MSEQLVSSVTTVLLAIVGVAIIAVLVSRNANTTGVISAGGSAFARDLATAEAPVTGYGSFSGMSAGLGN